MNNSYESPSVLDSFIENMNVLNIYLQRNGCENIIFIFKDKQPAVEVFHNGSLTCIEWFKYKIQCDDQFSIQINRIKQQLEFLLSIWSVAEIGRLIHSCGIIVALNPLYLFDLIPTNGPELQLKTSFTVSNFSIGIVK